MELEKIGTPPYEEWECPKCGKHWLIDVFILKAAMELEDCNSRYVCPDCAE